MIDSILDAIAMVIIIVFYFAPSLIAGLRHHANAGAIMALNLLTGWTLLGWIVAFVWSCTNNIQQVKLVSE